MCIRDREGCFRLLYPFQQQNRSSADIARGEVSHQTVGSQGHPEPRDPVFPSESLCCHTGVFRYAGYTDTKRMEDDLDAVFENSLHMGYHIHRKRLCRIGCTHAWLCSGQLYVGAATFLLGRAESLCV